MATAGDLGPDAAGEGERKRFERALGRAYRYLGHRDRSEAELRRHLIDKGTEEELAEAVVLELRRQGYVDDARFARLFAEDRRALDGWGGERIAQRLEAAGVAREHVDAAPETRAPEAELEAAITALRRRFPVPPADDRERDRALRLLVRRGYELELAYDAVRAVGDEG